MTYSVTYSSLLRNKSSWQLCSIWLGFNLTSKYKTRVEVTNTVAYYITELITAVLNLGKLKLYPQILD
jgi:hypothetical protein